MDSRILVRGEIDLAAAPDLQADIERAVLASTANLVIDCEQLEFIDSTGVHVLLRAQQLLEGQGRSLRLVHVGGEPLHVLEVLQLTERLGVEAVAAGRNIEYLG